MGATKTHFFMKIQPILLFIEVTSWQLPNSTDADRRTQRQYETFLLRSTWRAFTQKYMGCSTTRHLDTVLTRTRLTFRQSNGALFGCSCYAPGDITTAGAKLPFSPVVIASKTPAPRTPMNLIDRKDRICSAWTALPRQDLSHRVGAAYGNVRRTNRHRP